MRYWAATPRGCLKLQVNLARKMADQGALANTADTATVAYISPGLSINVTHQLQIYAFVQLSVYSRLAGYLDRVGGGELHVLTRSARRRSCCPLASKHRQHALIPRRPFT